jgi:hypothetical protein
MVPDLKTTAGRTNDGCWWLRITENDAQGTRGLVKWLPTSVRRWATISEGAEAVGSGQRRLREVGLSR